MSDTADTSEQQLSGGAAFWAARGVRIEPEAVDEDSAHEQPSASAAEPADAPVTPDASDASDASDAEPEFSAEAEPEDVAGETADAGEPQSAPEPETEPEPEPEPALPDFPQQRTSAAGQSTAEPAWQLSGDELAPLPPLKTCVEAILMVVDEPVPVVSLAQVLERPTAEVADALVELAEEYTVLGRGFELREVGIAGDGSRTGWRIYSRAACAPVVERFVRDGQQAKLTQAALETLAVVAYRQPVSRSKVSAIRGVNCDGVMRTLLARGLVEEYGNDLETGAVLYQTTGYFLERMGLKSLDELPDLAPLLPSAAEADIEDFA